ncbi:hypothetical protein MCOR21_009333 [Pyricularia oryzae]|nr:hypothetical protein MCOR21_009333 [Pyricularia oryzae]
MANLMAQACERCWKRKQRCDRRRPVCQQCRLVSAPCYERRHGVTVDLSDPASQFSYIEGLKQRIRNLEHSTAQSPTPQRYEQASTAPKGPVPGSGLEPGPTAHQTASRASIQAEMGSLSLAAMAEFSGEQHPAHLQARPFLSFQTLFRAAAGSGAGNLSRSDSPNPALTGPLGDFYLGLLRCGVQMDAFDTRRHFERYLDVALLCFPLTGRAHLDDEFAVVSQSQTAGTAGQLLYSSPAKVLRVYVAVATGILLTPDCRHMESFATTLALAAHQHLPRVAVSAGELETVQCLMMLTIFSLFSSSGGSTWHLLGLALSRCLSAGMHHVRVSDPLSDDDEKRGCSRCFWCLYALDTLISTSLDRPFLIQDEDITTPQPPPNSNPDHDLGPFHVNIIQCARLLRDARRHPSKGALFHFFNMRHFIETAPRHPQVSDTQSALLDGVWGRLCCGALLEVLSSLGPSQRSPENAMVTSFARTRFIQFIDALDEQHSTQSFSFMGCDGLMVFKMAAELLLCDPAPGRGRAQALAQKCIRLLVVIAERFPAVRSLREVLEQLAVLVAQGERAAEVEWVRLERDLERSAVPIPVRVHDLIHSFRIHTPATHRSV